MNRKEINDLISAKLWDRGFTHGYVYECELNGEFVSGGISNLRKQAKVGDRVQVDVYSRGNWWMHESVTFYIEQDDELVDYYKRIGRPRRRYRNRDYQRQKVYDWEQQLPQGPELRLSAVEDLIAEVFDTYGVKGQEPRVEISRRKKVTSTYFPMTHTIKLAAGWGQSTKVVLHETAHALIKVMGLNDVASHGREFVSLVMELYQLFLEDATPDQIIEAINTGIPLGAESTVPEIVVTEDEVYGRLI